MIGIFLVLISIGLGFISFNQSLSNKCVFSLGSRIGDVDVSGLSKEQAISSLATFYEAPLRIVINGVEKEVPIERLGYEFQYEKMVEGLNCNQDSKFTQFWNFIWNKTEDKPVQFDLVFNKNEDIYEDFIDREISLMVAKNPVIPSRITGTTRFNPGVVGIEPDLAKLKADIDNQIIGQGGEPILVETIDLPSPDLPLEILEEQVLEIVNIDQFPGVIEIYSKNFTNDETLQILLSGGRKMEPGVAFTAASTMKIPILLSTYWRNAEPLGELEKNWIEAMIVRSENDPADRLMEQIDTVRGPLLVTNDLQSLGFENTFIAGYFYLGAPLLDLYQTPANQRTDVNINPDVYNQTTPQEIGELLEMIYHCSKGQETGLIQETNGLLTMDECQQIIDILARNEMGALIEAGLPEKTIIAHKHGWSQERDGLVHSFSDVAIVYGPQSDFVLTIFLYSDEQLLFDVANPIIARVTQTIFNAYNLDHQISWPFPEN